MSFAGAGEVDGDGLVYFLVAAPGDSAIAPQAGSAVLFTGAQVAWEQD